MEEAMRSLWILLVTLSFCVLPMAAALAGPTGTGP